jgi:hypothetical protein
MAGRIAPSQFTEPNIVTIGTQVWMNTNLSVVKYNNGDPIPEVQSTTLLSNLTTGAWCWYSNDPAYNTVYGKLYNHYAVTDPRGIAPDGWRVATNDDYTTLTTYIGASPGAAMKTSGTTYWTSPNTGTNISGFSLKGGGYFASGAGFFNLGTLGLVWTSISSSATGAWRWGTSNTLSTFASASVNRANCLYVRCVKI